jgi:hypothetical protein
MSGAATMESVDELSLALLGGAMLLGGLAVALVVVNFLGVDLVRAMVYASFGR